MNTNLRAMNRLQAACAEKGPLCVGLDTDPSYLPPETLAAFGSPAEAVLAYNRALIEATGPYAACFKVQIAYYEAMGLPGLAAYAETLKAVRAAGIPVIADVKRGDIADTAKAYARAHFEGDFEADIITINPYMGFDTLEPFLEYVESAGKGAFVLLRTSNPGMKDIEWLPLSAEGSVAAGGPPGSRVLDAVGAGLSRVAVRFGAAGDVAPFGAVVGCTEEADARALRDRYPNLFFLIPGYGAQGGAARIAATLLDRAGGTVNSSRGILTAWKKDPALEAPRSAGNLAIADLAEAAGRAALTAKNDLLGAKASLGRAGHAGPDGRFPRAAETVAVTSNAEIAPGVLSLVASRSPIRPPETSGAGPIPAPLPGQFFMLRARPSGVFLGRPISVYRSDADSITFLVLKKGEGTAELCALGAGDRLDVVGPVGNTFRSPAALAAIAAESRGMDPSLVPSNMGAQRLAPDGFPLSSGEFAMIAGLPAKPRVAVLGGGIGIAPVAGFALGLEPFSFDFFAAFRSGTYGLEGLAERARRLAITTEDGSAGTKGMLPAVFNPAEYDLVYACGPTPMLKYVKEACAGRLAYVSLERRMACGAGACLGCTVETVAGNRRCCVDGPVFPAAEVMF